VFPPQDSIKICLAFSIQLEDAEPGIQQLILFVQQQLQRTPRAALGAWEALTPWSQTLG
jgi:hypothetical protein